MKRSDLLPLAVLLPVAGFVVAQIVRAPRITATTQAAVLMQPSAHPAVHRARKPALGSRGDDMPVEAPVALDVGATRERIRQGAPGTYINEILQQRDSAIARWPDRLVQPVRVWVGGGAGVADWKSDFQYRVYDAFDEWSSLGIPVRFTFVSDSAGADVKVSWIDHFADPISGKTLWARDRNWWIVNGTITLALHHNGGESLDDRAVKAIALHEIGHLLGLDHTSDTTNIMTPRVRVRDLSDADRATMRLLYSLPPGSIK
jgi:hypothetical protein